MSATVLVVAVVLLRRGGDPAANASAGRGPRTRTVPVVTATARLGDMPVHLDGLGTVTAVNTVTVRSRVDGQLLSVAYREGQLVREGALLAEIDARPFQAQLHQAQGQLAKDEATLANARLDLRRYDALLAEDSIPKQQRDTQAALVEQLRATLESDRAQVETAQLNVSYCRIRAPISGRVGLRLVDPGNMVHASDQNGLVVIAQLAPIAVVFTVPVDQLAPVSQQVARGRKLEVEAWDRDLSRRLATGTLDAIDNQVDTATGSVRLKALFANQDDALFSNQFVNARLLVDVLRGSVLLPTAALQRSPQQTFVWVVKPDATVEMRTVELARSEGDVSAVRRGIDAGETVVVEGVDNLQAGTKVALPAPQGPRAPSSGPPGGPGGPARAGQGANRSPGNQGR